MPDPKPPHEYSLMGIALARFHEAFGDATLTLSSDHQWSLKTAPFANDVCVLIYGRADGPIVWIFDPNDRNDGVTRSIVQREGDIPDIIEHVRDRVGKASRTPRKRVQETADEEGGDDGDDDD